MRLRRYAKQSRKFFQERLSAFRLKLNGVTYSRGVRISGKILVQRHQSAKILIGENVILNAKASLNSLEARGPVILNALGKDARISIGPDTGITSATLSAMRSITIGERVLIGAGVMITDSDHHVVRTGQETPRRHLGVPESRPQHAVTIGDDAFIGARSIVLKGVHIGANAVIGAGSVVVSNVEANSIVAGNPAKLVSWASDAPKR